MPAQMTTGVEKLPKALKIVAWLFFRSPEEGWRQHAVAALIALAAIGVAVMDVGFATRATIISDVHAFVALDQALVLHFCGDYSYFGPGSPQSFDGVHSLESKDAPFQQPFSESIKKEQGSLAAYCSRATGPHVNNENSLFLLDTFLLSIPPNDSPRTLELKMEGFRFGLLFIVLYVLALFGAGLLPLAFVALAAIHVVELTQQSQPLSMYPTLCLILLLTSALLVLFWKVIKGGKLGWLAIASLGFGLLLAFVYNFRTSYGLFFAVQIVALLLIDAILRWKAARKLKAYAVLLLGVAVGATAFHLALIRPIQIGSNSTYNYTSHVFWHPILLGLANPPNEFAAREGIQWNDAIGIDLAKRVDPQATYLGPRYEAALRTEYFRLWREHPRAMLDVYAMKIFETGRSAMSGLAIIYDSSILSRAAQKVIPNGWVWYFFLLVMALPGLLVRKINASLGMFITLLACGLFCASAEQTIVEPGFSLMYQGGLIVGSAVLIASVAVLFFAGLMRLAAPESAAETQISAAGPGRLAVPWVRSSPLVGNQPAAISALLILTAVAAGWWLLGRIPESASFAPTVDNRQTAEAAGEVDPNLEITSLDERPWVRVWAPTRVDGHGLDIDGAVSTPAAYAAVSGYYQLPKGARVAAAGTVTDGGISFGLLDERGNWAAAVSISPGKFRKAVAAPAAGRYRILVANALPEGQTTNNVEVTQIGMVALDPAKLRVDAAASTPAAAQVKPAPEQPEIGPLDAKDWQAVKAPARLDGQAVSINGVPTIPAAYAAVSVPYRLPKGAVIEASGTVKHGGLALGLLDSRGQWATTTAIPEGDFRTTVQAPADGEYQIVIANNVPAGQTANDAEVNEVRLVGLDPAKLRVNAPASPPAAARAEPAFEPAEIRPLGAGDWQTVTAPARLDGKGLSINGVPTIPAAYAAVSVPYRLPKGAVVAAAGTVTHGGLALGLLDSRGQWATTAAMPPGEFRTAVQAPADGEYQIVIANNVPAGQTANDAQVTEVGLVGLDPAKLRVHPPASVPAAAGAMPTPK